MKYLEKFRRITTSGDYFAEIDGLRFIAIITVILFHITASVRYPDPTIDSKFTFPLLTSIYHNGWQGVELFFAISGFIIGLPFARQYILGGRKVNLKSYFLRRITRLEPPYLVMIILYFLFLVLSGKTDFFYRLPSLLVSMVYMNNFVYNNIDFLVISVIWSLEIEVQFYILAVFFSKIFMLPTIIRRLSILAVIYGFPILQYYYYPSTKSIYLYMQFFFIGFLLADLYLDARKINLKKYIAIPLGIVSLSVLLYLNHAINISNGFIYLTSMIIFYYLAITNDFWRKIMSIQLVAIIGGMCYTIYLIHGLIITNFASKAYLFRISDYYIPNLLFNTLILLPAILFVSAIYFRLIERPCMDKTWPTKLKNNVLILLKK